MPGNQGGKELLAQSGSSVKGWNKATLNPPTLAVFVIASRRKSVTVLTSQCIRCSGSHTLLLAPVRLHPPANLIDAQRVGLLTSQCFRYSGTDTSLMTPVPSTHLLI